jgi:hypothetical protein
MMILWMMTVWPVLTMESARFYEGVIDYDIRSTNQILCQVWGRAGFAKTVEKRIKDIAKAAKVVANQILMKPRVLMKHIHPFLFFSHFCCRGQTVCAEYGHTLSAWTHVGPWYCSTGIVREEQNTHKIIIWFDINHPILLSCIFDWKKRSRELEAYIDCVVAKIRNSKLFSASCSTWRLQASRYSPFIQSFTTF